MATTKTTGAAGQAAALPADAAVPVVDYRKHAEEQREAARQAATPGKLMDTIEVMRAISSGRLDQIAAVARLARGAVSSASPVPDLAVIRHALSLIAELAEDTSNLVGCEAEEVGCGG